MQGPSPQNQSQGIIQTFTYDTARRLKQVTTVNTGAYVHYDYGPDFVSSFGSVNSVAANYWESDTFTHRFFDGLGRMFAVASNHPGSTGGNKGQYTRYDQMGRAVQQTNPFEMNSVWQPAGDDNAGAQSNVANTFDWKGRPLKTYNMDGTYKEASYAGCGCAGGEVVTLTDEVGRQQKVYADVLGRQWKTEVLNWNGSVYSATVKSFNARDQVTLARQWSGAENGGGAYQDTTMSYDGYGRLESRHSPEQNTGTATVYAYNTDDTLQSVTDARGVTATYGYNSRHLLTGIDYPTSVPNGVSATTDVSFTYDAAGNRLSMTDGTGSTSYVYDQLSRMSSETKTFSGLSGSFTLAYQYNPANQPTSVTDQHSGASFSTGYDNAGRVYSVNGVGYNSTSTTFVSSASYRAWGGLKSSAFGNSTSVTLGYNSRGLITSYSGGGSGAGYQYYADGQVKFAQDQSTNAEPIKDRAFSYDHAGRLQEAYSGSEARNFINSTSYAADGAYRQSYSYDVWSNTTNQNWRFWSRSGQTSGSYNSSNRNTLWSYDAEGNLLGRGDGALYAYDAAGNEISQHQETSYYDAENNGTVGLFFVNTEGRDGDGQLVHYVKQMDHNFNGGTPSNSYTEDVFNLRSTVLGGLVISEYSGSESWRVSYVYLGGERIGTQLNNGGTAYSGWRYVDPITGDEGNAVLDPQGVDVGHEDPFPANGSGDPDLQPDGSEPFKGAARMIPIEGSAVRCVLDGITVDCGFIRGEISVQCPNNDCGPQRQADGTLGQPFQAFVDGWSGYLPRGAVYDGNGKYHMPRPDGDRGEGQLERLNHAAPQKPHTGGGEAGAGGGKTSGPAVQPCPPVPPIPGGESIAGNVAIAALHHQAATQRMPLDPNPGARVIAHVAWFAGMVAPKGPWDYKQLDVKGGTYIPFGNFNFGAAGIAAGFSEGQLLRAAGVVQYWVGDTPGNAGAVNIINALTGTGGQEPFRDERVDQENIKAGINWYTHKFVLKDCK